MICIIDYGMGNVGSVRNALQALGAECRITRDTADLDRATHLILPGVGAFGDGMRQLRAYGLTEVLTHQVMERKKPILGICLGMQLLAQTGEEGGIHEGLGWIRGRVRRFQVDEAAFRVPHIGWNDVTPTGCSPLFAGVLSPVFYFVHSFFLEPEDPSCVAATCEYGEPFAAAICQEQIHGVQFHPEKSQKSGLAVLKNFLSMQRRP